MHSTADRSQPVAIRPAVPADREDVLRVRQAQEFADAGAPSTTADALAEAWLGLGPRLATQVWVASDPDGSLIACVELARVDSVFNPCLWVLPEQRARGLELALLAQAERQACALGRAEGAASITLFAQATGAHPAAQQALVRSGYLVTSTYEQMELVLSEPPASLAAIAGIALRPFDVGQDAEAVYHADEEAFADQRGYMPRSFERWCQRLHLLTPTFDPAVCPIAWAGAEVAGAALGEVVAEEDARVGWIHHLSVRRPWRRRGLGAALMLAALGALHQRGVGRVRLNVDAQSLTNAHQLYRRLGFDVTGTYANYRKVVTLA